MKPIRFSISVLAVNHLELNKNCIRSIRNNSEDNDYELILTDNNSEDGTGEYFDSLAVEMPSRVRVVHNKENLGFIDPNNHALTLARGTYFCCLNNDAEVPPGWLEMLEKPFEEYETAAISGPVGSCCALRRDISSFMGDMGQDFEYVEGSCLCIPAKLARKHTLFSPFLQFAYGEDVDLSLRMRARGMTIHQVPFQIVHQREMTTRSITFPVGVHAHNQKMLMDRWGRYLYYRRLDLPIIIRREAAFGDVLLVTPLLRALHDQQPKSEIWFETKCPEVLANHPYIQVVPRHQQVPFEVRQQARFINLDMEYENRTNTHIVDAYFEKALIIPSESDYRRTEIYFTNEDRDWAERELPEEQYVAVHASASSWKGKEWDSSKFNQLCGWLEGNNWKVVLVGSGIQFFENTVDLRGRTTAQQLAAVLKRCQFFIGIDSFPMHVAESVGIPVIGLFGVTDPKYIMTGDSSFSLMGESKCAGERHRVIGKTCIQCDGACINSISVEQVIEKVNLLDEASALKSDVNIYSREVEVKKSGPVRFKEEMSVVRPYQ